MSRLLLLAVLCCSTACLPRVTVHQPELDEDLPAAWDHAPDQAAAPDAWLADFDDPRLPALVGEAWEHNHDLARAAANLRAARAVAEQAGALRQPQLDLQASGGRSATVSRFGNQTRRVTADTFSATLNLSWELDLWGRLSGNRRAALASLQADTAAYEAARLSLATAVVEAWFQLTHDRAQLELAQAYHDNLADAVELVAGRWRQGAAAVADLHLTRGESSQAAADLAARRRLRDASARQLAVLLGRYPHAQQAGAEQLPPPPEGLRAGQPADLLWRRPDLRAAAARLLASDHRLLVARADLLPRISLTASGGARSDELGDLVDPEHLFWNVLGNLFAPLLDGGRRRAVVRERQAQADAALAAYRDRAYAALREVETALAGEQLLRRELQELERSVQAQAAAAQALRASYDDGQADALDVLTTMRSVLQRRQRLLTLRLQLLRNRLTLYKALGGPAVERPVDEAGPQATPPGPPPRRDQHDRRSGDEEMG